MSTRIGERIRQLRKKYNLSLDDVANSVGVTKATVSKWERGVISEIGSAKLESLSALFNMPVAYFTSGEPSRTLTVLKNPSDEHGYTIPAALNAETHIKYVMPDDSMHPKIPVGAVIGIELTEQIKSGDMIAVTLGASRDYLIRNLSVDEYEHMILIPQNTQHYHPIALTRDLILALPVHVIGRIVSIQT